MADSSHNTQCRDEGNRVAAGEWQVVKRKSHDRKDGEMARRFTKWDIAGSGGIVRRKDLTSYYFTEIPEDIGAVEMLNVFQMYGEALEVVIPSKRDRRGKRYGFVRFERVKEAKVFGIRLDNIIISSKKIFVNLPRFARSHPLEGVNNIILYSRSCVSRFSIFC